MSDSEKETREKRHVKHDWTFFVFIAVALVLIASAIAWASSKSGVFSIDAADSDASAVTAGSGKR
jgi:hypothetical protein